ncbi:hypothetical protein J4457_06235 [Candidatus Woesearchaeota archaeon]|nr:hypothetical protein [Candidatus Woesearchaeota archaeon]
MNKISIRVKRAEVTNFLPAKAEVQLSVWFQHSSPHVLHWNVTVGDKDAYTEKILTEIKKFVKSFHPQGFSGNDVDDILGGHQVVLFENEEETFEKLNSFMGKIQERLKKFKSATTSTGYLSMISDFQKMSADF